MNIAGGRTLSLSGQGQVFLQSGGAITNNGSLDLTDINFVFNGGNILGNAVYMVDCRLEIGPLAGVPAAFTLTGLGSRFFGNVKQGQTLWLQGSSRGSHTTVIAPKGFLNEGTLRLESIDAGFNTHLSVTNGVFTNAVSGVVNINAGTGGSREWFATIVNQGTINVNYSVNCNRSGGGFLNEGTINIASGQTLTIASPLTQADGVLRLNGGTLDPNDSVALNGGVLTGSGTVAASVTNAAGQVSPGASAGTLAISGVYVQGSRGTLEMELGGPAAGTEYDRLAVGGAAILGGRLAVTLINGFVPTHGQSFTILTAAARSGTFTELQLPPLPGDLTWEVLYQAGTVVLRVADALPAGNTRICGRVSNNAGLPLTNLTVAAYQAQTNYNGLRGDYFDNANLTGLVFSRLDGGVNFNWGSGSPDSRIGAETFSVRWSGTVTPL